MPSVTPETEGTFTRKRGAALMEEPHKPTPEELDDIFRTEEAKKA